MKIVLIGFMATGKSNVAPILAGMLNLNIVEMDDLIVGKSGGKSIAEIFETGGEAAFRKLEVDVSRDLQHADNVVISTGGGVVMNETVIGYLADNAEVVELYASFETLLQRIGRDIPRPLFEDEQAARQLYELRKPLYNKYAAIHVSTDGKSIDGVAEEIAGKVQRI